LDKIKILEGATPIEKEAPLGVSISVIGLGLIGGSIAKAIKANTPHTVYGFDVNEETLLMAHQEGILDGVSRDPKTILEQSDVVFICLYPKDTVAFIRNHYSDFKDGAIVTDTAGLKGEITDFFYKMVFNEKKLEFIGGHPMAGSEKKGYKHSDASLLEEATFILTPHDGNDLDTVKKLSDLLYEMRFGCVTQMTPAMHDELVAYTSHLPHIIANTLLANKPAQDTKALEGGSFRDVTRVGRMNTALWQELILSNQKNVLKYLDEFEAQLKAVRQAIAVNNANDLVNLFNGN